VQQERVCAQFRTSFSIESCLILTCDAPVFFRVFLNPRYSVPKSLYHERTNEENMGTKGRMIVDMDVDELIRLLNKALSDEWLAYYQYWIGSKVVKGPTKDAVIAELVQHATEELAHADMIALRIVQLGGTPVLEPKEWYNLTNCGYDVPSDPFVKKILEQNIKGERCAIETYNKLMSLVKDKDPITYNLILTIISQEVEHEEDLQGLLEDLEMIISS
jgi:bacterioferritin